MDSDKDNSQNRNDQRDLIDCFDDKRKGKSVRDLRVAGVNIMKHNIFRHHALIKMCETSRYSISRSGKK